MKKVCENLGLPQEEQTHELQGFMKEGRMPMR